MPASGVRFDVDEATPSTISTPSFDGDEVRRRTVKQLARKHTTDNPGCSPSVFLTLLGLVICTVTLIVGIVFFNVQWRSYGVLWGGYLEWNCTLVSCHLRYSYTGTYRATGLQNFMVRSAKKFGNKFAGEQWEAVESWIQDFTNGKPESFPPLSNLPLCTDKTFQSWLFGGLCQSSSRYTKLIGGTIWGSDDGKSWDMVRSDTVNECKKGRVSEHDGWGKVTKFVQIKMKDRCGGGAFAIAEWQIFGVPAENLAEGIVPSGSSDSKWGRFAGATDGKNNVGWHAGNVDYPSSLTLNLGLATSISGMTLLTPGNSPNYGFKSLKILRSMDGTSWTAVRTDSISECTASRSSFHPGWPEKTKYVKIEMSERCGGGHFAVVEWQIFGTQDKCKGKLLPSGNDRFPCDSIKDEKACRKSYMKIPTGETFQCGVRKASEDVSNCLVVSECDVA